MESSGPIIALLVLFLPFQGYITYLIVCEILGFSDKTIFKDLPGTKIRLSEEHVFCIDDLKSIQLNINFKLKGLSDWNIYSCDIKSRKKLEFTIKELNDILLLIGEKTKEKYSLYKIITAYNRLHSIRNIGSLLGALSFLVILFSIIRFSFNADVPIDFVLAVGWSLLIIIDVYFGIYRGLSKVCHLLCDYNEDYKDINVFDIINGTYLRRNK